MTAKIRVLYVTGAGRSGSTVLDTVLGNHPDAASVGELCNAGRTWADPGEYCACGVLAGECSFWRQVRHQWQAARRPITTAPDWQALQSRFERLRWAPYLFAQRLLRSEAFGEYADGVRTLYEAIARVSGKRVIVDSSKSPLRAQALTRVPGIDLRLIHLVRDGRGVAWSLMKAYREDSGTEIHKDVQARPLWHTALMWRVTNRLAEIALENVPQEKRMRLRYEDFVEAPCEALTRIERVTGLEYRAVATAVARGDHLNIGHVIAGNRVRMSGAIRLRADVAWRHNLTRAQRALFWGVAGAQARRYGYTRELYTPSTRP